MTASLRGARRVGFVVVALAAMGVACKSSTSAFDGANDDAGVPSNLPTTLKGTYVPVNAAAPGEFQAITFFGTTGYIAYRTSCDGGSACRTQGTYTFDGKSDLALTDNISGAVEHVVFAATEVTGGASATADAAADATATGTSLVGRRTIVHPLDLVGDSDGGLVTSSGGPLVETILQALMNGVAMQLFGGRDDGGANAGYCQVPNGPADCALQGLSAHNNGDGSCSCVTPPGAPGFSLPITLMAGASGGYFPSVKISVGGSEPLLAILDTGSSGVVFAPGVIPAGAATPTGQMYSAGYGPVMKYDARLTSVPIILGPNATNGGLPTSAITVGEITQITKCPTKSCSNFKFAGTFDAIFGVGMRSGGKRDNPLANTGTDPNYVISLDGDGATTGHLYLNPHQWRTSAFTWTRSQLLPDGSGGWADDNLAFCANDLCGGGTAGNGALLDSGNTSIILKPVVTSDYTTVGLDPNVTASQSPPSGTSITFRIGTQDPSGNDTSPSWTLTTNSPATPGIDLVTASPTVQSNNLGLSVFQRFDVLYDLNLGQIGLTKKSVARICDLKEGLAADFNCATFAAAAVDGGVDAGTCSNTPLAKAGVAALPDAYQPVLDAMAQQLGCTVLRVPIDPDANWTNPSAYPPRYQEVLAYARSLGMKIYANPLSTGTYQWGTNGTLDDVAGYAQWIADYGNAFLPDYLGPFNESGITSVASIEAAADQVRSLLTSSSTLLVGPDSQHLGRVAGVTPGHGENTDTLTMISPDGGVDSRGAALSDANLPTHFDILSSHNADVDTESTVQNWSTLVNATGRPVWSSENPQPYNCSWTGGLGTGASGNGAPICDTSANAATGVEIGVAAAVQAGVTAVVLYNALPAYVDTSGTSTANGTALAAIIP